MAARTAACAMTAYSCTMIQHIRRRGFKGFDGVETFSREGARPILTFMSSKSSTVRVLVVDDEIDHADVMAEAIARMPGYSVKQAHNLADAKRALIEDEVGFDLVVTD